jgi:alpha,alpha-trehalase
MLFYLFSAEEVAQLFERLGYPFDARTIPNNVDYYLRRTSNGSTLSNVVSSWVLARTDRARSWTLFTAALQSDFADVQGGTTREGIHLGAMAGTVDLIQRCYLGIETRQDSLWLNPRLPHELVRLRLKVRYRHASLSLDATHDLLKVRVLHCPIESIRIGFHGRVLDLQEHEEVELNL